MENINISWNNMVDISLSPGIMENLCDNMKNQYLNSIWREFPSPAIGNVLVKYTSCAHSKLLEGTGFRVVPQPDF